ncbi:hypothetical protein SADUNF_Sadunf14G0094900 [Salix dunnii]|uniref:Uncharacterized protein n=1 Tax=Salix dunnii TaxID=1413687 RepID=A0A835JHB0_9ROSI|nr:hypothetical protein SADUNF_Sadunf14G0094900 [Salix dunnii]
MNFNKQRFTTLFRYSEMLTSRGRNKNKTRDILYRLLFTPNRAIPMSFNAIFIIFLILSPLVTSSSLTFNGNFPTAYEILVEYNFPIGILPEGAIGYKLDKTTGEFSAFLNGSCSLSVEGSYQLEYKSTIRGYISDNRLESLSGVSVKVLFFWLNIVEVIRNEDELVFSVGIASANFPIDNFSECPQCGWGLTCNNVDLVTKLRSNPFVVSDGLIAAGVHCPLSNWHGVGLLWVSVDAGTVRYSVHKAVTRISSPKQTSSCKKLLARHPP